MEKTIKAILRNLPFLSDPFCVPTKNKIQLLLHPMVVLSDEDMAVTKEAFGADRIRVVATSFGEDTECLMLQLDGVSFNAEDWTYKISESYEEDVTSVTFGLIENVREEEGDFSRIEFDPISFRKDLPFLDCIEIGRNTFEFEMSEKETLNYLENFGLTSWEQINGKED